MQRGILQHCVSFSLSVSESISKDVHIVWIRNMFWRTVIFSDTSIYVTQSEKAFAYSSLKNSSLKISWCIIFENFTFIIHTVKVKVAQSCLTLHVTPWTIQSMEFSRPEIPELVAVPFSRGSSQPRDRTQVSRVAGGSITSWAPREAQEYWSG